MIGFLANLAVGLGLPQRFARAAVIGLLIVLAVGGLLLAKSCYDDSLIERHDAERDADLAEGGRAADANAAETRREDDARLSTESIQLNEVIANASIPDVPSDARRRYYECVRLQQQRRVAGDPAPACD